MGSEAAGSSFPPAASIAASGARGRDQRPSRLISIGTASKPAARSPSTTDAAEATEISCSLERPPESTATRSRLTPEGPVADQPLWSPPWSPPPPSGGGGGGGSAGGGSAGGGSGSV